MGAFPGSIDTARQPPMTVPLRHFLVGFLFLLGGVAAGLGLSLDRVPGLGTLVHVHLLFVGWVCVTIMGAMTQFVPVWSGVSLYSRRLAHIQLGFVVIGLLGFAIGLLAFLPGLLVVGGVFMLGGFWTFSYNIARTLARLDRFDVTERHFALTLGFFVIATTLGVLLAVNLAQPIDLGPISPLSLLGAHATVAVFGAVLTTVYGALYQLGTMFTQTDLHGIDHRLRGIEELAHPVGVVALAGGRLVESTALARSGAILVILAALAFGLILARKLYEMRVPRTPMHTRYGVVTVALFLWVISAGPAWLSDPTGPGTIFGGSGSVHLLAFGVFGFVILGTLYHIIPFIVWVHRYSDDLGYEAVPMIDDLYSDQLAATDGMTLGIGTVLLVVADVGWVGTIGSLFGGGLIALGVAVFISNMLLVLHRHGPQTIDTVVLGSWSPRRMLGDARR